MKKLFLAIILLCHVSCDSAGPATKNADIVIIGAGIMSGTLATLLYELDPKLNIQVFERLGVIAGESTGGWNNAGTGHAGYCELNYTPDKGQAGIDLQKAIDISEAFELSMQFWAYEKVKGHLPIPFIKSVPHASFVWGAKNIVSLKRRYEAMIQNPLFAGMEYSEDQKEIQTWFPVVIEGRAPTQDVAATRVKRGTDVDFGILTKSLFAFLERSKIPVNLKHEVKNIERNQDGTWTIVYKDLKNKETKSISTRYVFIGAGGGTLKLLQKSGIPEARSYGGVPIGGQWLISTNEELIRRHDSKVYGRAANGAPPMSVPHLDARYINGKKALLFGPFATFSTKFLKYGSWLDMPLSFTIGNFVPMIQSGLNNVPLTGYLIQQLLLSPEERLAALREYLPKARMEDWSLATAGQRVQLIKDDPILGGILQFGTELVVTKDGTLSGLLGASPGASVAVDVMLEVIEKAFPEKFKSAEWQQKLTQILPSFGKKLADNPELLRQLRKYNATVLGLSYY